MKTYSFLLSIENPNGNSIQRTTNFFPLRIKIIVDKYQTGIKDDWSEPTRGTSKIKDVPFHRSYIL